VNTSLVKSAILFPLKNLSSLHIKMYFIFFIFPIVKHNDFAVLALAGAGERREREEKKKHSEHLSFQSHTKFSIMKTVTNAFVIISIRT